jgi:hypothetical protein
VSLLELPDREHDIGGARLTRYEYFLGMAGEQVGGCKRTPFRANPLSREYVHCLGYSHLAHFTKPNFTESWAKWLKNRTQFRRVQQKCEDVLEKVVRAQERVEGFRFESRVDLAEMLGIAYATEDGVLFEGSEGHRVLVPATAAVDFLHTAYAATHPNHILGLMTRQPAVPRLLDLSDVVRAARLEIQRVGILAGNHLPV